MMLHICYALIWGQPLSKNKEIHHSGNTVDGFSFWFFVCLFFVFVFFKICKHFLQWEKICIDTFIFLIKYHKINVVNLWKFCANHS